MRAGWSVDADELRVKDEGGLWGNDTTCACITIPQLGGDAQDALLTNTLHST
jgi:hypothetical protein